MLLFLILIVNNKTNEERKNYDGRHMWKSIQVTKRWNHCKKSTLQSDKIWTSYVYVFFKCFIVCLKCERPFVKKKLPVNLGLLMGFRGSAVYVYKVNLAKTIAKM